MATQGGHRASPFELIVKRQLCRSQKRIAGTFCEHFFALPTVDEAPLVEETSKIVKIPPRGTMRLTEVSPKAPFNPYSGYFDPIFPMSKWERPTHSDGSLCSG